MAIRLTSTLTTFYCHGGHRIATKVARSPSEVGLEFCVSLSFNSLQVRMRLFEFVVVTFYYYINNNKVMILHRGDAQRLDAGLRISSP